MSGNSINEKNAEYIASILKNPTGLAVVMYRTFTAMEDAGFTEAQAMEMTKHTMMITLGMGAAMNESD